MAGNRDPLGRFLPGNRANPKGRPRLSDIERLQRALMRVGFRLESARTLLGADHGEV